MYGLYRSRRKKIFVRREQIVMNTTLNYKTIEELNKRGSAADITNALNYLISGLALKGYYIQDAENPDTYLSCVLHNRIAAEEDAKISCYFENMPEEGYYE